MTTDGDCAINSCSIISASSSSSCTPASASELVNGSETGGTVTVDIDTTNARGQSFYCLECSSNEVVPVTHYSNPFAVTVNTCEGETFEDNAAFSNTGVSKLVGDSAEAVYTFAPPTTS